MKAATIVYRRIVSFSRNAYHRRFEMTPVAAPGRGPARDVPIETRNSGYCIVDFTQGPRAILITMAAKTRRNARLKEVKRVLSSIEVLIRSTLRKRCLKKQDTAEFPRTGLGNINHSRDLRQFCLAK
jgi:hypothetical protein